MIDRSKKVVLLIDWDNLQICHSRDAPGTELDLTAVTALAQSYGTLVSARAYAEWNLPTERLTVYKAGIEPVFAPVMRPEGGTREGKSLADTVMVADGVDLLWTVGPDVFVMVTSDKDMIPLARLAKQRGAAVVVLGSDLTAIPLVELSNVFITYRQLLRELVKTNELGAPSGRSPARERGVRTETRRPTGEPISGRRSLPQATRASTGTAPAGLPPPLPTSAGAPTGLPAAAPAPMPAGDGSEVDGAVSAEGIARRRRRRGGRSRGRGGSGVAATEGQAAANQVPEELAGPLEDPQANMPAPEAQPASTDLTTIEEPTGTSEPQPQAPLPSAVRAPRPRRAAARPTFSEFGAAEPLPTEAAASSPGAGGESGAPPVEHGGDLSESLLAAGTATPESLEPHQAEATSESTNGREGEQASEPERPRPARRRSTRPTR